MSGAVQTFVVCDRCGKTLPTTRATMCGARGDAERKGWRVSHMADGRHPDASNDPKRPDECPECRPDKPKADEGLFA